VSRGELAGGERLDDDAVEDDTLEWAK